MPKPLSQTPRGMFIIALADWQRAWTDHTDHDRRAASAGFATATGRAHFTGGHRPTGRARCSGGQGRRRQAYHTC